MGKTRTNRPACPAPNCEAGRSWRGRSFLPCPVSWALVVIVFLPLCLHAPTCLTARQVQSAHAPAASTLQKGITFVAYWSNLYSDPDADVSMAHLAATGADWISLIAIGHQDTIASTTIIYETPASPSDADLIHAISSAHALGLNVMLKPHVDIANDADHWRGDIGDEFTTESLWADWFASYRDFINHYADLATSCAVEQFSVGCELAGTEHREADWRTVIDGVRARYSAPITYAANHGDETTIAWWDALDFIGVDAYYPLTGTNEPTLDDLRLAWAPHAATLADLAATWEKTIILTEIGYRSVDGANCAPWDFNLEGPVDLGEQALAYQAAFESVFYEPWFSGMFWWTWSWDPFDGGPCNTGYTPRDKMAEDVVRSWYGAPPHPTPTPTPDLDYSRTMDIYRDELGPGWENWSWDAALDLHTTLTVFRGTCATSVTLEPWGALSFWHPSFDTAPYYWLEFYIRGSFAGDYHLWVFFNAEDHTEYRRRPIEDCRYIADGTIEPETWKRVTMPLCDLDAADRSLARITFINADAEQWISFRIDEIRLVAGKIPSTNVFWFFH